MAGEQLRVTEGKAEGEQLAVVEDVLIGRAADDDAGLDMTHDLHVYRISIHDLSFIVKYFIDHRYTPANDSNPCHLGGSCHLHGAA